MAWPGLEFAIRPNRIKTGVVRLLLALVLAAALIGCGTLGGVTDGTSLSRGYSNGGVLRNGTPVPLKGQGYLVPATWRLRGNTWGTTELVALVVRAAERVSREAPGNTLYLGDMSPRYGGPSRWHHSHQNGRDADLIFYALDEQGRPAAPPPTMWHYGDDGWTVARPGVPRLEFDTARNWMLVRAIIEDGGAEPQYLFISNPLRDRLLAYAHEHGESEELIEEAAALLQQPMHSAPHDDHLHLRIMCPVNDRDLGCRDRGPLRWTKKIYKYLSLTELGPAMVQTIALLSGRPFCHLGVGVGSALVAGFVAR
jgi:penicillin-insensitive murein endopeptidase